MPFTFSLSDAIESSLLFRSLPPDKRVLLDSNLVCCSENVDLGDRGSDGRVSEELIALTALRLTFVSSGNCSYNSSACGDGAS